MLHTHGTAPNSLHHTGRRCQKAGGPGKSPGKQLELVREEQLRTRSSAGTKMYGAHHSAVLLRLADHNTSLPELKSSPHPLGQGRAVQGLTGNS